MGSLITVVGNTGVGKTTLVRSLCSTGNYAAGLEEHLERPFQALFRADRRYALANQLDYLLLRAEQERAIRKDIRTGIQDGGLDLDFHVFTRLFLLKGYFSGEEFSLCERLYRLIRADQPSPELIIWLQAPPKVIEKRFTDRQRGLEIAAVDDLAAAQHLLEEWLGAVDRQQLITVDGSKHDPEYTGLLPGLLAQLDHYWCGMDDSLEQYKKILDNLYDGIYFVDPDRRITYWNGGAERITGFKPEDVIGHRCMENILNHVTENGVQLCLKGCPLHATLTDGKPREAEVYLHHADGHRLPILIRTSPIRDENGRITGAVETFSDNSSLLKNRRMVSKLEKTVRLDPVTGVGNRRHAVDRVKKILFNFQQHRIPCGLLFIDIDDFKSINDTYGHSTGDRVLRMVAATLKNNVRAEDTVTRWGGEEFLVLLEGVNRQGLLISAEKMLSLVENAFLTVRGKTINVTISIGATMVHFEDDFKTLLNRADQAMYKSKEDGKNRITLKIH